MAFAFRSASSLRFSSSSFSASSLPMLSQRPRCARTLFGVYSARREDVSYISRTHLATRNTPQNGTLKLVF